MKIWCKKFFIVSYNNYLHFSPLLYSIVSVYISMALSILRHAISLLFTFLCLRWFAWIDVCIPSVFVQYAEFMSTLISLNLSSRWLWATMRVVGTQCKSYGRAVRPRNHWTISLASIFSFSLFLQISSLGFLPLGLYLWLLCHKKCGYFILFSQSPHIIFIVFPI